MSDDTRAIVASTFHLSAFDIANGQGVCTVTLRSGVQLTGEVDKNLSGREVLHLLTRRGWHTIDYTEIAAITGERQ